MGFTREIVPSCEALKTDRAGKIGEAIVRPLVCLPSGHLRVAVRQVLEHRGVKSPSPPAAGDDLIAKRSVSVDEQASVPFAASLTVP